MSTIGLVGRRPELAVLDELVARTVAGTGAIVLLSGAPGIGKTRLALETTERRRPPEWGSCGAGAGRARVHRRCGRGRRSCARSASILTGSTRPPTPPLGSASSRRSPTRSLPRPRAIRSWSCSTTSTAPASCRCACSPTSVTLPGRRRSGCSSRTATTKSVAAATVAVLARLPGARRCQLGGLGLGDVAALLDQAAIDGPTLSAAELLDRTAGNPLFVTELLCLLADGGPADCMPASVGEVAMTRLAALPAATRQALELAAVLGRDFDHAVLAAAMRASPEVALEALDAAVAAGLVTSDRSASFRFVQAVVRDAVASQLPPSQRAAAHHAVHAHEVAIGVRLEAGDDQRGEPAVVAESRRTHPR